jgi:hypothetical protein
MSEIDMEGAIEALQAVIPESYDEDTATVSDDVVDDTPDVESFTKFDPNVLPEDMQKVYRSMQADYTRKTQEIADIRRQAEAFSDLGVDADSARNMIQFYQRLDSDPQFLAGFVSNVQSELEQAGYSQNEAAELAPTVIDERYGDISPMLAQELGEMRQFREQVLYDQEQANLIGELEGQEQSIRLGNPHYSDDDISAIYSLAYSTGGDLSLAANEYHGIQQRLLGGYLQSKQVPVGLAPTPSGPSTIPARTFSSLDEAHKAAMEAVRNAS